MRFAALLAAAASLISVASAGTITFYNKGGDNRLITFTRDDWVRSQYSLGPWQDLEVDCGWGWSGNFKVTLPWQDWTLDQYILGEVTFNGYNGFTSYDVSALLNEYDNSGIHWIYTEQSWDVRSGCDWFPCNNAYKHWDDHETCTSWSPLSQHLYIDVWAA